MHDADTELLFIKAITVAVGVTSVPFISLLSSGMAPSCCWPQMRLERSGPATFPILVELQAKNRWVAAACGHSVSRWSV
jgi:hypothetical protein